MLLRLKSLWNLKDFFIIISTRIWWLCLYVYAVVDVFLVVLITYSFTRMVWWLSAASYIYTSVHTAIMYV